MFAHNPGVKVVYAVIEEGSHQYKVEQGTTFELQRHDLEDGQTTIEFDRVLMVGDGSDSKIGRPYVDGAKVVAHIVGEIKGNKIHIIKYRRRKGYHRKIGHRQRYLQVKVEAIQV